MRQNRKKKLYTTVNSKVEIVVHDIENWMKSKNKNDW